MSLCVLVVVGCFFFLKKKSPHYVIQKSAPEVWSTGQVVVVGRIRVCNSRKNAFKGWVFPSLSHKRNSFFLAMILDKKDIFMYTVVPFFFGAA